MKLYKWLTEYNHGPYSGFEWPLPSGDEPGAWVEVQGDLEMCKNGIHACRRADAVRWIDSRLYEFEHGGSIMSGDNKIVVRRGRLVRHLETWNDTTARLFAADCAERVLPIFEREHPTDLRPRKAVEATRAFARGEIDTAARDAAWAAARDAARDAAGDAAWAAAGAAAGDAAWDAAWAAARAAARAARDAAREWQTDRLFDYIEGRAS